MTIKATKAYDERVQSDDGTVIAHVVEVTFEDGRFKRYVTMPDGSMKVEEDFG